VGRHPARLLGEDVGGEHRVNSEGSAGAVFIEDGGSDEDDKDSEGAADEDGTGGQLWIEEGETAGAQESAKGGIGLH
jgi:hypothetical protein